MRYSRGMGAVNPEKLGKPRQILRKDALEPVKILKKGGETGKNWISGAIKHPGALHSQLGVPQGEKIPAKKLKKAASGSGLLAKRARLAETLKGFHKK